MRNSDLKEVLIFFAAALSLSFFVFWGPIAILKIPTVNLVDGEMGPIWAITLFIIGGFVPSILGLILTGVYEGKKGIRQLLRQSVQFNLGYKWFGTILFICLFFAVSGISIYQMTGREFDYNQFLVQLPTILPLIILGPLSEEYGWRGFAAKRLLRCTTANLASLWTGLVWALWHLPLFFMAGTTQYEFSLPFFPFLISVNSSSFIYTYLYMKTNQSLFSAILLHWLYTYIMQVIGSSIVRSSAYNWLEFIPSLLLGLIFAFLLSKEDKTGAQVT